MHNLSCKVILENLKKLDILNGLVDEMFDNGVHQVFMCH